MKTVDSSSSKYGSDRDGFTFLGSRSLRERFHGVIPGGSHTYAKGDDQYPDACQPYIVRGQGCHVWDIDGNEFIEYSMGLRAVTLGHAYPEVIEAAHSQMQLGENFNRPGLLELECAEELRDMIPGAEMVKFGKNGSDVTSAALKLARAYSGRDLVAICSDHPFYSVDDWFIGTTAVDAGIPTAIKELTVGFRYNDLASLKELFASYPDQISCVIMEPEKSEAPRAGFLEAVRETCHANGALFILDEMITGFRWHLGGGQAYHGVQPDLSSFGKAIGNGLSVSALVGREEIMRLGGLEHEGERVFLLSATHGAELHGLAAAREVMRIYREEPVIDTLWTQGRRLQEGLEPVIARHGLNDHFVLHGKPCCLMYGTCDVEGKPSQEFRTLFLQEIMRRGLLAPSFIVSYSHRDNDIDRTVDIVDDALGVYARALEEGVEHYLVGRPVKPVYRKFN